MKNRGFEYIANMSSFFQPKTPVAALRAAEKGLLPPEAFIYKAVSIEPLVDNPGNLDEIERILGQKGRDLKTNILMVDILNKLIKNDDKEIALFAAESLNAIENDYNRQIEALPPEAYRERARLFSEMAVLNRSIGDLRKFYYREAFSNLREIEKNDELEDADNLFMSLILIELGLLSQAKSIITDNGLKSPDALFILADIEFRQRDYAELYTVIKEINRQRSMLDSAQTAIVDFWLENK